MVLKKIKALLTRGSKRLRTQPANPESARTPDPPRPPPAEPPAVHRGPDVVHHPVAPGLGLTLDPKAPAKRDGRDPRTLVDDALRPIAVRLRIARKDQEHTRQALTTLQRMVPLKPMRRGAKLALMRRPAFGDAMATLEAVAPLLGGEFAVARSSWAETAAGHGAASTDAEIDAAPSHDEDEAAASTDAPRGRRRRGRRGGRGRRKDRGGELEAAGTPIAPPPATTPGSPKPPPATSAPAAAAPVARGPKLPPVWDDNYFFAALPSVPTHVAVEDEGDAGRYGGGIAPVTEAETDDKPSPSGRKRRRGGRRHRKGGPIIPPSGSSSPQEGDAS